MAQSQTQKHKKLVFKGKAEAEYAAFLKALGDNIRARRQALNLTQDDLDSQPFSIDERNFRRIEAGTRNVTVKTLFAVCKKLKIQPKHLFDFDLEIG